MAASLSPSEVDCTCPVCCDIFKDPVVLLCGHSFCKDCLQEWWRQSGLQQCPVCREMFPMPRPPHNLALRNLSDNLRRAKTQGVSPGSKELCYLHSEKLKLFCQDDQQPICVICRDSKQHKKHNCVPINEVAEDHKNKFKISLMNLKTRLWEYKREKQTNKKMASHIKLQAQETEKTIRDEFQKLYQFLRAEETTRIDAVRKEEVLKSQKMKIRIANLDVEIASLTEKIRTIEEEMKAEDIPFMLNVKSTMNRSRSILQKPATPVDALIDEAKHIGNLLFKVWEKMKSLIQYTPVLLDPNTGGKRLAISELLTRVTSIANEQPLPVNPERQHDWAVLGSEGFSSGKHSWHVELGRYWSVGVATKPKHRAPAKFWYIYRCECIGFMYEVLPEDGHKILSEDSCPCKVELQLDYDQGKLTVFDLGTKIPVSIITDTFTEPVFPFFCKDAKILPYEVVLTTKQLR